MSLNRFRFPAVLLSLMIAIPAVAADEDTAAVCAEAEERYVDMFGHPSSQEEGVTVVTMYKYKFCPEDLSVPVGTTVRWVNVDKRTSHSVILKDEGVPESDRLFPEEAFEFTFLTAGDPQTYLCGPHWETQEMIGTVTVTP
ncbi:plastocyanin/azurin family copper-binding protein [Roseibium sp. MMSF_3544]|uniref:cupredoxin domain-containing protein n=1 Tax=unclassified Roseibium TaxID=2629323 RepID=UPI0027400D4B|nr:plastocyanin/azurin family copper-binding protein [Roseibium sp. MMSF_3544]